MTRRPATSVPAQREATFLQHYLGGPPGVRYNGIQSALAAGIGTTPKSAGVMASRLLAKVSVQAAIRRFAERAYSTAEKAVARTALRAYADARDVMTWDGTGELRLQGSTEIGEAGAALIAGLTQRVRTTTLPDGTAVTHRTLEVRLHDGDGARRDLLKLHGLLRDAPTGAPIGPLAIGTINVYVPDNGRAVPALPTTATREPPCPSVPLALPDNGRGNGGPP